MLSKSSSLIPIFLSLVSSNITSELALLPQPISFLKSWLLSPPETFFDVYFKKYWTPKHNVQVSLNIIERIFLTLSYNILHSYHIFYIYQITRYSLLYAPKLPQFFHICVFAYIHILFLLPSPLKSYLLFTVNFTLHFLQKYLLKICQYRKTDQWNRIEIIFFPAAGTQTLQLTFKN